MTQAIPHRTGDRCEDPFLIIAGVAKAGTTSQFEYLAAHPGIVPCATESPFYFLPKDYPSDPGIRYETTPFSQYLSLFAAAAPNRVRFEASPLYLHAPGVPELIQQTLPNSRIMVSVREPIARLMSYYQMAVLFGWLPRDLTFDQYVDEAFRQRISPTGSPFYKYPMDESRYAERIRHWQDVVGKERFLVVLFDEFKANPAQTMSRIATFAGLDGGFYNAYRFDNQNPGRQFRRSYVAVESSLKHLVPKGTFVHKALSQARRRAEPWVRSLVTQPTQRIKTKPATMERLREYYADDVQALSGLLGQPAPWARQFESR